MLAEAILVHGVIGYKFCWLLPEDQNQGTPAGHESAKTPIGNESLKVVVDMNDSELWAQGFRCYEQIMIFNDMNYSRSWVQAPKSMNNSSLWMICMIPHHVLKSLYAMKN